MSAHAVPPAPFVKPSFILGIDPGLSGALAFYEPPTGDLIVVDTPVKSARIGGKLKFVPDPESLGILLDHWRPLIQFAVIERVHAMPKQGVTSSFNFGDVFGLVRGSVHANIIPVHYVEPSVWKRAYGLTGGKDNKRESLAKATKLFPKHADKWTLRKHDGRAEAAILAHFGSRLASEVGAAGE